MAWDRKAKREARNYDTRAERVAFEIGYGDAYEGKPSLAWETYPTPTERLAYCAGYDGGDRDRHA